MPQLDTIYTMLIYVWTWSIMYMMSQKIKTLMMTHPKMKPPMIKLTKTMTLPWL